MIEITQCIPVNTPLGKGTIFLVSDAGVESKLIFHVILLESSKLISVPQDQITFERNFTAGRGRWADLKKLIDNTTPDQ